MIHYWFLTPVLILVLNVCSALALDKRLSTKVNHFVGQFFQLMSLCLFFYLYLTDYSESWAFGFLNEYAQKLAFELDSIKSFFLTFLYSSLFLLSFFNTKIDSAFFSNVKLGIPLNSLFFLIVCSESKLLVALLSIYISFVYFLLIRSSEKMNPQNFTKGDFYGISLVFVNLLFFVYSLIVEVDLSNRNYLFVSQALIISALAVQFALIPILSIFNDFYSCHRDGIISYIFLFNSIIGLKMTKALFEISFDNVNQIGILFTLLVGVLSMFLYYKLRYEFSINDLFGSTIYFVGLAVLGIIFTNKNNIDPMDVTLLYILYFTTGMVLMYLKQEFRNIRLELLVSAFFCFLLSGLPGSLTFTLFSKTLKTMIDESKPYFLLYFALLWFLYITAFSNFLIKRFFCSNRSKELLAVANNRIRVEGWYYGNFLPIISLMGMVLILFLIINKLI